MNRNNSMVPGLLTGFAAIMATAGVLLWRLTAANIVTGVVWGVGVAYAGVLVYYALIPRPGRGTGSFFRGYLPGALLRYVIMIGAFSVVVFWLKINALGVLIGTFGGMMAATFVSLNKMRQTKSTFPEA
jgi:hypothetical protein